MNIEADRFYVSQKERTSIFGGNVQIKMDQDELNATKVYVYFDLKNKPLKYQADGNVSFFVKTEDNATYVGTCQSLVYTPKTKEYHFMKEVRIEEKVSKRTLNGEKILVNVGDNTAIVEGEQKKPIRITLDLDDKVNKKRTGLNSTDANESKKIKKESTQK